MLKDLPNNLKLLFNDKVSLNQLCMDVHAPDQATSCRDPSFSISWETTYTYFLNDCNVISHAGQPNVIKTSTMRNKMAAATETDINAVAVATLNTTVKNTCDDGMAC